MLKLNPDMTDAEIVQALGGVDNSDQWLAIENADDETKARAQRLWDLDAGEPRAGGEDESPESEGEERVDLPDGDYTFTRGEGNALYVYDPGASEPGDFVAVIQSEESGRVYDTGTVLLREGHWDRPVVTGNVEDETAEKEAEDATDPPAPDVPPAPPMPPVAGGTGESEGTPTETAEIPQPPPPPS